MTWPAKIVAQAKALWLHGMPREQIVAHLQDVAHAHGRVFSEHVLNGFALRRGWGQHPLSKQLGKLYVEDGHIYNGRASDEMARLADDKVSAKVSPKLAPKREPVAQSTCKQSNGLAKKSAPSRSKILEV